jgi:hypothetical protein
MLLLLSALSLRSQNLLWSKILGSEGEEYTLNHLTDMNNNVYVSGKTTGSVDGQNLGQNDGFLMKLDNSGKIIWKRQFGSDKEDDVQWSAIDNNGNVYLAGFTLGSFGSKNKGKEDIFIVKYDPAGKLIWQKQFGTDSTDIAKGICIGKEGSVYITGGTNGTLGERSSGKSDCFVMKCDVNGNILSSLQFGTPEDDLGYSIAAGNGSGIFLCGTTWGSISGKNHGFIDCFTAHMTGDLIETSFNQFGSDGFDIALVLHPDKENNLYVGGSTSGNFGADQKGEGDCFLLKLDQNGNILWHEQFGTEHHDGIRGIDVDKNVIISGIQNLPPEKAFIRIYDSDGKLKWEKTFEGTSGKDVIAGKKGFTHLGLTGSDLFGPLIGGHDIYLLKYSWK